MYQHAVIRALRCDYCVGLPPDIVQVWQVTICASRCAHRATPYRKLVVKVMYPDAYPEEPLRVELSSGTLVEQLVEKLNTMAVAKV